MGKQRARARDGAPNTGPGKAGGGVLPVGSAQVPRSRGLRGENPKSRLGRPRCPGPRRRVRRDGACGCASGGTSGAWPRRTARSEWEVETGCAGPAVGARARGARIPPPRGAGKGSPESASGAGAPCCPQGRGIAVALAGFAGVVLAALVSYALLGEREVPAGEVCRGMVESMTATRRGVGSPRHTSPVKPGSAGHLAVPPEVGQPPPSRRERGGAAPGKSLDANASGAPPAQEEEYTRSLLELRPSGAVPGNFGTYARGARGGPPSPPRVPR